MNEEEFADDPLPCLDRSGHFRRPEVRVEGGEVCAEFPLVNVLPTPVEHREAAISSRSR
jgi:hypothetical protein